MEYLLIVQISETSAQLLRWLRPRSSALAAAGIRVRVNKMTKAQLTAATVQSLRKQGVTRFPAMMDRSRVVYLGNAEIMKKLEAVLARRRSGMAGGNGLGLSGGEGGGGGFGSTDDNALSAFYSREMYAGYDSKGRAVPRGDADEGMEDLPDYNRMMTEYSKRAPPQRRARGQRAAADDGGNGPVDDEEDNIPSLRNRYTSGGVRRDDTPQTGGRGPEEEFDGGRAGLRSAIREAPRSGATGDDMDSAMLDAWMNNNVAEY